MNDSEVNKQAYRNACSRSLYFFAKHALGYPDINRDTHGDIISALEDDTQRKLIVVPRGTLKSTLACVAYPLWRLIKDANERVLLDSEVYENSKNFIREIKGKLESPMMTYLFGQSKSRTWNEGEIIIKQRTIGHKEASITAGGVATTKVGQHYSIIISDDLNSPNNSNTPENCRKVIDHYRYNISILEPHGTYVIVGTRYSELDIIGHVLKNELSINEADAFTMSGKTINI